MNEPPPATRPPRPRRTSWFNGLLSMLISATAWRRGLASRFLFVFIVGIGVGFALSTLLHFSFELNEAGGFPKRWAAISTENTTTETQSNMTNTSAVRYFHHNMDLNSSFAQELLRGVEEVAARKLANEVRILCWIMTYPGNHKSKAFHVKATWGRHCNEIIFASEAEDLELPAVKLNVPDGRNGLWAKTVEAFKYVHSHYRDSYDWVLKADDDTYVVVENLRSMLLPYKPFEGHYFGFQYKPHTPMGYTSGGAGYVLSKESVDRVVTQAFDDHHKDCPNSNNTNAEDINIAKCLLAVGVKVGDSRDALGRNRFFPFDIEDHVNPNQNGGRWWYTDYRYWPIKGGMDCCSDKPVSFHYVTPTKMYMLEFLVYHVNTFPVFNLATAEPITDATQPTTETPSTTTTTIATTKTSSVKSTANLAEEKKDKEKEKEQKDDKATTIKSADNKDTSSTTAASTKSFLENFDPLLLKKLLESYMKSTTKT